MIAEVIARLRDTAGKTGLKLIDGAAEFQALVEGNAAPKAAPAAYVIPARKTASPSNLLGRTRQRVGGGVVIVLVVKNVSDAKGKAASVDIEALSDRVNAVLLGWSPTAAHNSLEYGGGWLAQLKNGHMWWQDAYNTQSTQSSA